jgi:hypothetical protein
VIYPYRLQECEDGRWRTVHHASTPEAAAALIPLLAHRDGRAFRVVSGGRGIDTVVHLLFT